MKNCRSQLEFSFFEPRRLVCMAGDSTGGPVERPVAVPSDPIEELNQYEKNKNSQNKKLDFTLVDLQNLRKRLEERCENISSQNVKTKTLDTLDKRLKTLEFYLIDLEKSKKTIQDVAQKEAMGEVDFQTDVKFDFTDRDRGAADKTVDEWLRANVPDFEGSDQGNQWMTNKTRQVVHGLLVGALLTDPARYAVLQKEIVRRYKKDRDDGYIADKTAYKFDWKDLDGLKLYDDNTADVLHANDYWLYSETSGLGGEGLSLLGHAHENYLATLLLSAEKFFLGGKENTKGGKLYDAYKAFMISYLAGKKAEIQAAAMPVSTQDAHDSGENWAWKAGKTISKHTVTGTTAGTVIPFVGNAVGTVVGATSGVVKSIFTAGDNSVFEVYKENFEKQQEIIYSIPTPQEWYATLMRAAEHVEEEKQSSTAKVAEKENTKTENPELLKNPLYKEYFETVVPYSAFIGATVSLRGQMGLPYDPSMPKALALMKKVNDFGDLRKSDVLKKFQENVTSAEIRDAAYEIRSQGEKFLASYQAALKERFGKLTPQQLTSDFNTKHAPELSAINFVLNADFSKMNFFEIAQVQQLNTFSYSFFALQKIEKDLGIAATPAAGPANASAPQPAAGVSGAPTAASKSGTTAPAASTPASGNAPAGDTGKDSDAPTDTSGDSPASDGKGKKGGKGGREKPAENPEKLSDEQKEEIRKNATDYFEIGADGTLTIKGDGTYTKEQAAIALRLRDIEDPEKSPDVLMVSPTKKVFSVAHYESKKDENGKDEGKYMRRYAEGDGKIIPAYIHEGYKFFKDATHFIDHSDEIFADMPAEKDRAAEYVRDKYTKLIDADGKITNELSRIVFAAMLQKFAKDVLQKQPGGTLFYPLVLSDTITINYTQDGFSFSDGEKVCNGESPAGAVTPDVLHLDSFETTFEKISGRMMDQASEEKLRVILKKDFEETLEMLYSVLTAHSENPYPVDKAREAYDHLIVKTDQFQNRVSQFLNMPNMAGKKAQSFAPIDEKESAVHFSRSRAAIGDFAAMADALKDSTDTKNYVELFASLEKAAKRTES